MIRFGVLMAAVSVSTVAAQGTIAGQYKETRTRTTYVGERAAAMGAPRDRVRREWQAAGFFRMDGMGMDIGNERDSYIVTRRGEPTPFKVRPSDQTVVAMGPINPMPPIAPLDMKLGESRDLGDGGLVLGHRTRKSMTTYTRTSPAAATSRSKRVTVTVTMWTATDPSDPMVAEWLALIAVPGRALPKEHAPGVLLRSETRTEGDLPADEVSTSEVTDWRREQIDTAKFSLPANYKRTTRGAEMQAQLREAQAMHRAMLEARRLMASGDPQDRARARQLSDSMLRVLKIEGAAARYDARTDPRAITITDPAAPKKKP